MIRAWHTLCTILWLEHLAEVSLGCAWVRIKLPFCVYGFGGVRLRYLECSWCAGAGKNFVIISLGFAVVFTPPIYTFPSR